MPLGARYRAGTYAGRGGGGGRRNLAAAAASASASARAELPAGMRARWTMGAVRPDCVPVKFAKQFYQQDGRSSLEWRGRVPHAPLPNGTRARVCFIHYGGPLKNELMRTTIARWRQGG